MMPQTNNVIALMNCDRTIFIPNKSFGWDVLINSQHVCYSDCYAEAKRLAELANSEVSGLRHFDDIEADSDGNGLNPVYRVWQDRQFLGTFHQSPVDNRWLAIPAYGRDHCRHETPDRAQQAIVELFRNSTVVRSLDQGLEVI